MSHSTYKHNEVAKKDIIYWRGKFTPKLKGHKNENRNQKTGLLLTQRQAEIPILELLMLMRKSPVLEY